MAELQMQREVQSEYGFGHEVAHHHPLDQTAEVPGGAMTCHLFVKACKYNPPHVSKHHKFWPAHWYTAPLEKRFRNHPDNVVEGLCRCMHDLEHLKKPPKKPSHEEMRRFLRERR